MGVNLLNTMMASYLCSALLTGGFGEAAIPYQTFEQTNLVIPGAFGLWAIMALIAKIIDGVIDVPGVDDILLGLKTYATSGN